MKEPIDVDLFPLLYVVGKYVDGEYMGISKCCAICDAAALTIALSIGPPR
jgi:hypothetical protein